MLFMLSAIRHNKQDRDKSLDYEVQATPQLALRLRPCIRGQIELDLEPTRSSHRRRCGSSSSLRLLPRHPDIVLLELFLPLGHINPLPSLARLASLFLGQKVGVVLVLRTNVRHRIMTDLSALLAPDRSLCRGIRLARLELLQFVLVFLQPAKRMYGYVNGVFVSMLLHRTHNLIRKFLRLAVPSNLFKL